MMPLQAYLTVAAILFTAGFYCVLTRRNAVTILMGIELILNSANLNFVAFARYTAPGIRGQVFAIFVIIMAAAEVAIALAIVLNLYKRRNSIDVDEVDRMRG
ncbi:MAG: NADH-quinone oxidoreductase subunit NuoK [Candidatus Eisenbacteria bacterium]|nr:NADH-quinone oxidoreductase subunit NuoK [Candidatus Eisenbacteria bacterium]